MFKITVVDNLTEEKWILQGHLTGEFASELRANWQRSLDQSSDRPRVVDLSDVTAIDKSGEEVLLQMTRQHATFIATGVSTRYLLEELQARSKADEQIG